MTLIYYTENYCKKYQEACVYGSHEDCPSDKVLIAVCKWARRADERVVREESEVH